MLGEILKKVVSEQNSSEKRSEMANSLSDLESYNRLMTRMDNYLEKSERDFGSLVTTLTTQMSSVNVAVSEIKVKVEDNVKINAENTETLSRLTKAQSDAAIHLGNNIDRLDTLVNTIERIDQAVSANTDMAFIMEVARKSEYEKCSKTIQIFNWKPEVILEFEGEDHGKKILKKAHCMIEVVNFLLNAYNPPAEIVAERLELRGKFNYNIVFRGSADASYAVYPLTQIMRQMNKQLTSSRTMFSFALPRELDEGIKSMNSLLNDQREKLGRETNFSWSHFLFWHAESRAYCVSTSVNKQPVGLVCAVDPSPTMMRRFNIVVNREKTILKNIYVEESIGRLPKNSRVRQEGDRSDDEDGMEQEDTTDADTAFEREKEMAIQKLKDGAKARSKRAADEMTTTPERMDRRMNKKVGSPHSSTYQRRFSEVASEPRVRMPNSTFRRNTQEQQNTIQHVMNQHQLQFQEMPQQQRPQQQITQQIPDQFHQQWNNGQQPVYSAPGGYMQQVAQGQQQPPVLQYVLPAQPGAGEREKNGGYM